MQQTCFLLVMQLISQNDSHFITCLNALRELTGVRFICSTDIMCKDVRNSEAHII